MTATNRFLAIERRIAGDIYTSREAMDNLIVLCDDLGARFAGTRQERLAAEMIAERFRTYGLVDVRLEPYSYAGWSRGEAQLEIRQPVQRPLECISLPYCQSSELAGELIDLGMGTPAEFSAAADRISGKLVMVSSRSPHRLGRWIHRKEKYDRSVAAGAIGFIFASEVPGVGPETGSLQDGKPAPIPGISLSMEDAAYLQRLATRFGAIEVGLRTTDVNEPRTSWNVVADLPGAEPGPWTMLGSHYDGHDIAQGAHDPASGLVAVMEAARVLSAQAADQLLRPVRFVAWGTEEIGLIGSRRYAQAHADEFDQLRWYLNMDSAGGPGRKGVVLHEWPDLQRFFEAALAEMAIEAPVGQHVHPSSDHFPLLLEGVPTAGIGDPTGAPSGRGFGHTRADTLDKIRLSDLQDAAALAARLALRVANTAEFPATRRSPAEVEKLLETHPNLEGYRVARSLAASGPA